MKRDVTRRGTYLLQLTAYVMYFFHKNIYGVAQREAEEAMRAGDPIFAKANNIAKELSKHDHYRDPFLGIFEVIFNRKFVLPRNAEGMNHFHGAVIRTDKQPMYASSKGYVKTASWNDRHVSSRVAQTVEVATLDEIKKYFITLRLIRTTYDDSIGEDGVVNIDEGFNTLGLDKNYSAKGGIIDAGRFQKSWAEEAINSMFAEGLYNITAIEGLTKETLYEIIQEELTEKDDSTLRLFARVLQEQIEG
jgi:hypothetical protein